MDRSRFRRLLREVAHPNLRLLWQPTLNSNGAPFTPSAEGMPASLVDDNLAGLRVALPHLENVPIFHWTREGRCHYPKEKRRGGPI